MFSLSQPFSDVLELARGLAKSAKYLMCTMNNESQELNEYRIGQFGLRDIFALFLSSCYVGLRSPKRGFTTCIGSHAENAGRMLLHR